MHNRLKQWLSFFAIDEATVATLREFVGIISPHMESIMDGLYARLAASAEAQAMFKSPESMARARALQNTILLKPGRLDPAELEIMRRHASIGGEIIPMHPAEVIGMARRIALTHHERWDGNGYPTGLKGLEIPLEGRIAAICDVYDALASERPYKPAWPKDKVIAHIKANSGSHFDPALVEVFLSILPEIQSIQTRFAEDAPVLVGMEGVGGPPPTQAIE